MYLQMLDIYIEKIGNIEKNLDIIDIFENITILSNPKYKYTAYLLTYLLTSPLSFGSNQYPDRKLPLSDFSCQNKHKASNIGFMGN